MSQPRKCKAKSKRTGQQCKRFATPGYNVCYYHGSRGGAPKGSKNAMTYGAYVNKLLDGEEKAIFQEFYQALHEDFKLNKSSDRMSAEMACIYFVRLIRAVKGDNSETIYKTDLLVRNQLKDLKATKEKREGDTINLQTTPAEWAANLLVKYRASQAKETEKTEK